MLSTTSLSGAADNSEVAAPVDLLRGTGGVLSSVPDSERVSYLDWLLNLGTDLRILQYRIHSSNKPQLSAYHLGILLAPRLGTGLPTNRPPHSIMADLHSACIGFTQSN